MSEETQKRECGACTACCYANPVSELNKGPASPCSHCTLRGCDIYASLPSDCASYSCAWLTGILPAWAKPETTGLIADLQMLSVPPIVGARMAWVIKETRPNAAGSSSGTALIGLLAQTGVTGAMGIQVAEAGNIPLVLVTHDSPPGQGNVIEGILADEGSSAHFLSRLVGRDKPN